MNGKNDVDVGSWYRTSAGQLFEIVSLDGETIEIQYEDGDLEELDQESWLAMETRPAGPPSSALAFDMEDDESYEHTLYDVLGTLEDN